GSIPASLLPITGVIGFSETILTWQNMVTVVMVTVVSAAICYFTPPAPEQAKTAEDLDVALGDDRIEPRKPARPGDWLEFSPLLT
ncbi:short-chain fatty acid transporter, partial [Acinetobacter baumannii]